MVELNHKEGRGYLQQVAEESVIPLHPMDDTCLQKVRPGIISPNPGTIRRLELFYQATILP
jgi:hypothetical protein